MDTCAYRIKTSQSCLSSAIHHAIYGYRKKFVYICTSQCQVWVHIAVSIFYQAVLSMFFLRMSCLNTRVVHLLEMPVSLPNHLVKAMKRTFRKLQNQPIFKMTLQTQ
eukprot:XP_011416674.1 PREDICTED: uncharacterized protein LOC105320445 [Crassostrea gigas]